VRRGAWNRAPLQDESPDGAEDAAAPQTGGMAEDLARAGRALRGRVEPVAKQVGASVEAGLERVGRALDDPAGALGAELLERADLPELAGEAPLVSLAVRLDREADLWRGVAFRHLERAAWAGRLVVVGGVVTLIAELSLGAIGGFRALFGGELAAGPPVLLAVSAGIVALGALGAAWALSQGRRAQLELARAALVRADLAEVRLHRVAALLELRAAGPERYVEALGGLERELRDAR
jgi:hypothetical protein